MMAARPKEQASKRRLEKTGRRNRSRFEAPECELCEVLNQASTEKARSQNPLAGRVKLGKQGIEAKHRPLLACEADCSANIEEALAQLQEEDEKIFDYLVVLKEGCAPRRVEVHPADSTSRVTELIDKKRGTEAMLKRARLVVPDATWHWVVAGKGTIAIKSIDAYGRRLAAARIHQPTRKMTA